MLIDSGPMSNSAAVLTSLLDQINGGRAADALRTLDRLDPRLPADPVILQLRAEALRHVGRFGEAIDAYRRAGELGAGTRNWLAAGILLAAERETEESVRCLTRAHEQSPDDPAVLDALVTTLFNSGRHKEGIEFARRQLRISDNPTLLSRAALLLQGNDLYEESSDAFKRIVQLAPEDLALVGAALVPARFTCEWDWVEQLQARIAESYARGDFAAPQEYPLTNLGWCSDEAINLGVARAYSERMVPRVAPLVLDPLPPAGRRMRIGYLSSDFRNHATMHLMAGVLEQHDRTRFEIFAYDHTNPDRSEYRQRFLAAVEHHVDILGMSDAQAAARIAADQLDLLIDLKLYTGGGRAGIAAFRPAPLIANWLGFPGSSGVPDFDYILADRFVTPDASAPFYTEKFCRLPHSYQPNDRQRSAAVRTETRAAHGLPDDKFVFGVFNQSYKIDRGSFAVWMRVLHAVPDSVLWILGQSEAARVHLARFARQAGIDPARLVFAPFAAPPEHRARLPLADAVLDALIYNGHTTTSDALWSGVPVITARGRHFASRVCESLLNAMEVPELVGVDQDDMVRLATRMGRDRAWHGEIRARIAATRLTAPLFDTLRFTRNFERALELMVERQRSGAAPAHIDVPDCGPLPTQATPAPAAPVARLAERYQACPLCGGASATLGYADRSGQSVWHEPLPPGVEWTRCGSCGHVHTREHWNDAGRDEIRKGIASSGATAASAAPAASAAAASRPWQAVVERAIAALGGYARLFDGTQKPLWVDVGCGDGRLVMSAADHGFSAVGVDARADVVMRARQKEIKAFQQDFLKLDFEIVPQVLSMMDVLARLPSPRAALQKAAQVLRPGGLLIVGTPDIAAFRWKELESQRANTVWTDLENHHVFSRDGLIALLKQCGFQVVDLALSECGMAQVELYAIRQADPAHQAAP